MNLKNLKNFILRNAFYVGLSALTFLGGCKTKSYTVKDDFNNDGKVETMEVSSDYPIERVYVGDFDRDGNKDIYCKIKKGNSLEEYVLKGKGDKTFTFDKEIRNIYVEEVVYREDDYDLLDPANPVSPVSPLNPANPASPIFDD